MIIGILGIYGIASRYLHSNHTRWRLVDGGEDGLLNRWIIVVAIRPAHIQLRDARTSICPSLVVRRAVCNDVNGIARAKANFIQEASWFGEKECFRSSIDGRPITIGKGTAPFQNK